MKKNKKWFLILNLATLPIVISASKCTNEQNEQQPPKTHNDFKPQSKPSQKPQTSTVNPNNQTQPHQNNSTSDNNITENNTENDQHTNNNTPIKPTPPTQDNPTQNQSDVPSQNNLKPDPTNNVDSQANKQINSNEPNSNTHSDINTQTQQQPQPMTKPSQNINSTPQQSNHPDFVEIKNKDYIRKDFLIGAEFNTAPLNVSTQFDFDANSVSPEYAQQLQIKHTIVDEDFGDIKTGTTKVRLQNQNVDYEFIELSFLILSPHKNLSLDYILTTQSGEQHLKTNLQAQANNIYSAKITVPNQYIDVKLSKIKHNDVDVFSFEQNQAHTIKYENIQPRAIYKYGLDEFNKSINNDQVDISFKVEENSSTYSTEYLDFQLKYLAPDNTIKTKTFSERKHNDRYNSITFSINLNSSEIKSVLGLYIKDIENSNFTKISIPSHWDFALVQQNNDFEIKHINVSDNKITLTTSNLSELNNQNIELLVKSYDPFEPYSKIITTSRTSNNTIEFDRSNLDISINKYIITKAKLSQDNIIDFGLKTQYSFDNVQAQNNEVSLQQLNVYVDHSTKSVYGSLKLNFNGHISKYKNKWIELEFSPQINQFGNKIYPDKYKSVIKFDQYAKFGLNGFNPDIKFNLTSAKFVSAQSLSEYADINLNNLDFSFRYHLDYDNNLINQHLKNVPGQANNSNPQLLSNNLNLAKNELLNLAIAAKNQNQNHNTILYSEQNFYAWSRYLSFYHNNSLSNKLDHLQMIDENNNNLAFQIVQGREILKNTLWDINQNYNQAQIIKNLDVFSGWSEVEDQTLVNLNFKMDLFKNKLQDFYDTNSLNEYNKSILNAAFMFKDFKNLAIGEYLAPIIDFNTEFSENEQNNNNLKALLFNYDFRVQKLAPKQFKLIIQARYDDVYLSDNVSLHYFANQKNALLSEAYLAIAYPKKQNQNLNVQFNSLPHPDNTPSYATNLLLLDPKRLNANGQYEDLNYDSFASRNNTARRLFKDDETAGGLEQLRQRVFSFNDASSSSVSVLGPVLPNDPNDFRFYIVTNTHVSRGWNTSSHPSLDTQFKHKINANFRIPNIINKPQDYEQNGFSGPLGNELYWKNGFDVNLDLVSNYRDVDQYWNFENVKDGYNNKINSFNDNSHARFDMSILIVDLAQFFNQYQNNSTQYLALDEQQKQIANYILNWKKLSLIKTSREAYHINNQVNLNWFFGGFPVESGDNKDGHVNSQRYREYILANSSQIAIQPHGSTNISNYAISFPVSAIDATGGASGTSVYDSEGNLAALYAAATARNTYTYLFNSNKWDFYGDGTKPFNRASFYEKMRLLSYLYPNRYNRDDFKQTGFKFQ
ncbi:hypothetical protein EG856_01090 [Mycoplasmopsis phocirhinis]|uniref:DUF31 domain-containing protein n=1 Tax=Mycoplasmopsis phocirhinis TaxID=142650 RepID=A0A4P6MRQ9_9BACT|nr:hypothetical protein [Mycoplasmopsis phocirhinis]QBF34521.1 hypothetical protein EG856_01090 [Mycoplasmopsis phocirhinis]